MDRPRYFCSRRSQVRQAARDGTAARPTSLAVGADGVIYLADSTRIYRVESGARLRVLAGQPVNALEDGQGEAAGFNVVGGLVVNQAGDVLFGDGGRLRKMTPAGMVTTLVGENGSGSGGWRDGDAGSARFSSLGALAFDPAGQLIWLDVGARSVRRISPAGDVTTLAATPSTIGSVDGVGAAARFSGVTHVASDSKGNLYVADRQRHVIRRVSPNGETTVFAGVPGVQNNTSTGAFRADAFDTPDSIAIDSKDVMYVIDAQRIVKIKGGAMSTLFTLGKEIGFTYDVAVDLDGNLAVAGSYKALILAPSGKIIREIGVSDFSRELDANRGGALPTPRGVAFDRAGNLYLADAYGHVIFKVAKDGPLSVFAGTSGIAGDQDGAPGKASLGFYSQVQMTFVPNGDMYMTGHGKLRKVSPDGTVSTPALAWGDPSLISITYSNGLLKGMTRYAVMQTPLPQ
ncbi:hypothetical protein [Massilia sp. CCM 8734]|uniref:hypothetical protein n=1 Tax=Massilia sp. CCM 8734 TaxID=2609283 RepID=UPI00141E68EC|nr:hypothetical protein [Massilia sp. CCM 8734]NIA00698.1 hypothetical protein [Massilia sp. CCM 8734]